jgi:hypothetical protein
MSEFCSQSLSRKLIEVAGVAVVSDLITAWFLGWASLGVSAAVAIAGAGLIIHCGQFYSF